MTGLGVGIYAENSGAAAALYCEAFGLEVGYHVLDPDGNYFHSELMKDGEPFVAVAQANVENFPRGFSPRHENPVELGFTAESREAFDRAFAVLSREGRVVMDVCTLPWSPLAAVVMDAYGVRWYLTLPQHRPVDDAVLF